MNTQPFQRKGEQCISISLNELLQLSDYAKKIPLPAFCARSLLGGQHNSRLLARGMEFAESRRYQPGDDIRNIDWRVTARTGRTHTKLFTAEKERPIFLGVDMRSSMFFATNGIFKSIQAALISGYMAWGTVQQGDRLGGVIFDNQTILQHKPALGKRGVLPFLNGIAKHTGLPLKTYPASSLDSSSTMERAIVGLKQMARPGSLVFLVSDFRYFSPFAQNMLLQIAMHSDLYLCFVYDALEASLPKNGYYPVTDGINEHIINTYDKKSVEKYEQKFLERRKSAALLAQQPRVNFIECRTDEECLKVMTNSF